eukprot:GEMP01008995.1.p1 GENE.GEMP01008995.1~~GEMP01008995.1.p1  ORF type:complete len:684 (+),score=150.40 GEMP01008995.1:135-2186(+)
MTFPAAKSVLWPREPKGPERHLCTEQMRPQATLSSSCASALSSRCTLAGQSLDNDGRPHLHVAYTPFRADEDESIVPVHCFPALRPEDVNEAVRARDEDVQGQNVSLHRFFAWILHPISRYTVELLCLLPKLALTLTPIALLPLHMSALATRLLSQRRQKRAQYGYLSLNKTRKVMCLLERDPQCRTLPIVGIWTDLPDRDDTLATFDHPIVWEASARFILDPFLDKVFVDEATYLIMVIYKADGNRRGYRFFEAKFAHGSADVIFGATIKMDPTTPRKYTANLDILPCIEFDPENSARETASQDTRIQRSTLSKLEAPRQEPQPHQMIVDTPPSIRPQRVDPQPRVEPKRWVDPEGTMRQGHTKPLSFSWSPDLTEINAKRKHRHWNRMSKCGGANGGDGLWVMVQMQQEHLKVLQQQVFELTNALSRSAKNACYNSLRTGDIRPPDIRFPKTNAPTPARRDACIGTETRLHEAQTSHPSSPSSPSRNRVERLEDHPDVRASHIKETAPARSRPPSALEERHELQDAPYEVKSVRAPLANVTSGEPTKPPTARCDEGNFAFESTTLVPISARSDGEASESEVIPMLTSVVPPSVTGALRLRNLAAQAVDLDDRGSVSIATRQADRPHILSSIGAFEVPRIGYQATSHMHSFEGDLDLSDEDSDGSEDERINAIMRKYAPRVR